MGDRPSLLVLHGGPGLTHDYLEPLAALSDQRQVIFYDQLGGGKSDRPDNNELWSITRFVDELSTVRSAVCPGPVHLFGHSWGTIVATEYALANPSDVVSLTLASPILSIPRFVADSVRLRDALPQPTAQILRECDGPQPLDNPEYLRALDVYYKSHGCRLGTIPESMQRTASGRNSTVTEKIWGPPSLVPNGPIKDYDVSDRLHQIDISVLLTCGRYDPATPDAAYWYASLFPKATVVIFEESSHLAHLLSPV